MPLIKYYLNGSKLVENQYDKLTTMSEIDLPKGIYKLDIYDVRSKNHMKHLYLVNYQSSTYFFDKNYNLQRCLFNLDEDVSDSDIFKIYINNAPKNLIFYIFHFKTTSNSFVTKYKLDSKVLDINYIPDIYYNNYYYDILSKEEVKEEFIIKFTYHIKIIQKKKESEISSSFFTFLWNDLKKQLNDYLSAVPNDN